MIGPLSSELLYEGGRKGMPGRLDADVVVGWARVFSSSCLASHNGSRSRGRGCG